MTKRQADVTENIFSKVGQRNPPVPDGFRHTDVEARPWSQNFPPTGPPKSRSVPIRWFGIFIQRLPRSKRRIANRDSLRWEFEGTGGTRNVERDLGTKINPKFTSPISEMIRVHFPDLQDQSSEFQQLAPHTGERGTNFPNRKWVRGKRLSKTLPISISRRSNRIRNKRVNTPGNGKAKNRGPLGRGSSDPRNPS